MDNRDICLEVKDITKIYPGTMALKGVDFSVEKGKVNVLVGENGAGKSTLMKIIAGIEQPTSGEIIFKKNKVSFKNSTEAANLGIGIIHQELSLFPNMTVMQNLFIGREEKSNLFTVNKKSQIEKTKKVLKQLNQSINPNEMIANLRVGKQQIVEIARNVAKEGLEILIMDEPTSSLSVAEVKILFSVIEDLKAKGIGIVYISHRLEELMQIGDNITVLRDGNIVANSKIKDITLDWIVEKMTGLEASNQKKPHDFSSKEEVLKVENLSLYRNGRYIFKDISFSLKKGEILGIYGLLGAGRTEVFEALMGVNLADSGTTWLNGKNMSIKDVATQIKNGFAYVPEDRQREGLIQTLNIKKNLTLSSLLKYVKHIAINKSLENNSADSMIKQLDIKVSNKELPILSLSGGNQQKVVIGKGMLTSPKIYLLDEPSRGIDIGAKYEVYNIIRKLAKSGISVIVISSELKEIIAIANRILVLSNGVLKGNVTGEEINEQNLVALSSVVAKA